MNSAGFTALRVAFVIVCLTFVTERLNATDLVRPTLVVRTYRVIPVADATWTAAIGGTGAILSNAGVTLEWVDCSQMKAEHPETGPARCTTPYERNEVALRIVSRPTIGPNVQFLLGDSLVDGAVHSGTLATIYFDHVDRLAREAHVTLDTVMARTMAHELGHLLLGTNAHSRRGLMRPVWTAGELARNDAGDWMIPLEDGVQMRLALEHRNQLSSE